MADSGSRALAVWSATVVALAESTGARAALAVAELDVGTDSATELSGAGLMTLASFAFAAAGGSALGGSVRGTTSLSLTGDCGTGIGVGAGVEAEDVSEKMLKAGLARGAGLGLSVDAGGNATEELSGSDGATCASGAAGACGTELKGAAGTGGDCMVGDWSRSAVGAPAGTGAWTWLSLGVGASEIGPVGIAVVENGPGALWNCVGRLEDNCADAA